MKKNRTSSNEKNGFNIRVENKENPDLIQDILQHFHRNQINWQQVESISIWGNTMIFFTGVCRKLDELLLCNARMSNWWVGMSYRLCYITNQLSLFIHLHLNEYEHSCTSNGCTAFCDVFTVILLRRFIRLITSFWYSSTSLVMTESSLLWVCSTRARR